MMQTIQLSTHTHRASRLAQRPIRWLMAALLATAVAACGGGGSSSPTADAEPTPEPTPIPTPIPLPTPPITGSGEWTTATPLGTLSVADITAGIASTGKVVPGLVPQYAVTSYRLEYLTTDADGKTTTASGLVSVPQRPLGGTSPVMGYLHGTTFVDAEAPSNSATAAELPLMLASMGFMVVAPDYVGYGASKGVPHPYLQAAPSAATVVDMLTATQTWQAKTGLADNGQLTLVGYSEGAYMAMAAQRAMTASQSPHLARLKMTVLGAGPYDVQTTMDGVLRRVRDEQALLGALLNPGFLRHLGSTVRDEVRRALLKQLIPDGADVALNYAFLDLYLADDVDGLERLSNVHRWKPESPVALYHGKDDGTVTYGSSLSALTAMQTAGAGNLVSLTDCTAQPSGHKECLLPFVGFMLEKVGAALAAGR